MKIEVILVIICQVCLLKSEKTDKLQKNETSEADENAIQYKLISDDTIDPNKFEISYEITFDDYIFNRNEKCQINEGVNIQERSNELSCTGKTTFSRTNAVKNITNFDHYTYSTNGFNHTGESFKVSGNFFRLNEIDLIYGLEAEPITTKLNRTQTTKLLQIHRPGKNQLAVDFTIASTFFALNRTENFSLGIDKETDTRDLNCHGQITVTVRNSDQYYTVQEENFRLDESYAFIYVNWAKLVDGNNTNNNIS